MFLTLGQRPLANDIGLPPTPEVGVGGRWSSHTSGFKPLALLPSRAFGGPLLLLRKKTKDSELARHRAPSMELESLSLAWLENLNMAWVWDQEWLRGSR